MKIKAFFLSFLLAAITFNTTAQVAKQVTNWKIDKSHSSISFAATHFKIATINGNFDDFSGTVTSNDEDFSEANFDVVIKTSSINTNQKIRDKDLRGADFFNADKNPEITFKSTSITKNSDNEYAVKGNLTVNGITKEFVFTGKFRGIFVHPRFKKTIAVLHLEGGLPRVEYDLGTKYPAAALGEIVTVSIDIEMIKQQG